MERKLEQNFVPFASGSEKYEKKSEQSPGPGHYNYKEGLRVSPSAAAFGSNGSRSCKAILSLPGPGSYNTDLPWLKPVFIPPHKKKIVYNTPPSIPVFLSSDNDEYKARPAVSHKKFIPKGASFAKAARISVFCGNGVKPGPGSYEIEAKKHNGMSFAKSQKDYILGKEICKESYYNEQNFSSFHTIKVPRMLQNFGNRCERRTVDIKPTLGPGYYQSETPKNKPLVAPFNSTVARFKETPNNFS